MWITRDWSTVLDCPRFFRFYFTTNDGSPLRIRLPPLSVEMSIDIIISHCTRYDRRGRFIISSLPRPLPFIGGLRSNFNSSRYEKYLVPRVSFSQLYIYFYLFSETPLFKSPVKNWHGRVICTLIIVNLLTF